MRKIGEVVRLKVASLYWPLTAGVADADLQVQLFDPLGSETRHGPATLDWPQIHRELRH